MRSSHTYDLAKEMGQPVAAEFYADRDYNEDGTIIFARTVSHPDADEVADKVLRAVQEGKVKADYGKRHRHRLRYSVCIHSDTPGAVEMAQTIRQKARGRRHRSPPDRQFYKQRRLAWQSMK